MTTLQLNENNISTLNDDCIYALLEWMSLDDLCLFSRTCKRFQSISEAHFRRKYSNNVVRVEIGLNGKLRIDKYVKYFDKFITKLYISVNKTNEQNQELQVSSLINFIKTKCDENLNKISVIGDIKLVRLGKETQKILKNVEFVELSQRSAASGHQDEAVFLKYCPKLSELLCGDIEGSSAVAILQQYSQLTQLKKLWLWVGEKTQKSLHAICSHLNVLNERGICTSVEIEFFLHFGGRLLSLHAKQLSNLKQLTKIHLAYMILDSVIPALRLLVHLKVIRLRCVLLDWSHWTHLNELIDKVDGAQNMDLPQVEEIQFDQLLDNDLSACVMLFSRHCVNLKRMLVPIVDTTDSIKFHIPELNRVREKLKGACELTIFTNHEDNATNLNHKLVKLKFVKFENCHRDSFQRYYIQPGQ